MIRVVVRNGLLSSFEDLLDYFVEEDDASGYAVRVMAMAGDAANLVVSRLRRRAADLQLKLTETKTGDIHTIVIGQ